MGIPLFYVSGFEESTTDIQLGSEETYHATRVLRLKSGDEILITNGWGLSAQATITDIQKENIDARIVHVQEYNLPLPNIYLAICPVKKREKTEWLVEKATEIGVSGIFFFSSRYSEREKVNFDRFEKIIVSAIKQSHNFFKPQLYPMVDIKKLISNCTDFAGQKLIAHCDAAGTENAVRLIKKSSDVLIMIGPEGGFTIQEVEMAERNGFITVSLGNNILRAETAAIWSLSVIKAINS